MGTRRGQEPWFELPANLPDDPRWLRGVKRLTARPAAPLAARKLQSLFEQAATPHEVTEVVYTFSFCGVEIKPLQVPSEFEGLVSVVAERSPRCVVEIGTAYGGMFFGLAWGASDDAILVSVDLRHGEFGGGYPPWRRQLYRSFRRASQHVHLIEGNSHEATTLAAVERALAGRTIDLLFIDGDHTYDGVRSDFEMYSGLVTPGGMIGFHDIVPEKSEQFSAVRVATGGVPQFWREVRAGYAYDEFVEEWEQGAFGIGLLQTASRESSGREEAQGISSRQRETQES